MRLGAHEKERSMHERKCLRIAVTLTAVLLLTGAFASADNWLQLDPAGTATVHSGSGPAPTLAVKSGGLSGFTVSAATTGLAVQRLETASKEGPFVELRWPESSSISGEVGAPGVPVIRRLFVIPDGATFTYSVNAGAAVTVDNAAAGLPARVLPVQPPIEKQPGAVENAPFAFDSAAYATNAALPAERATVQELGVARGQRIGLVELRPVAHNPVTGTLTVYPNLTVDVQFVGGSMSTDALPGLKNHVLNPELVPTAAARGSGNYVIIVAPAYAGTIASFADAKSAQGYTVTSYTIAAGATKESIKTYIAGLYANTATRPKYILLVGDTDTIPNWTGGGEGSPATDIQYVCMDGASDWYPDIALGRFSVRSVAQLQAIMAKTLTYENGPMPDPQYVKRAVFMASSDNYTVSEGTHNWVITNYMVPNEIVSDKLYCHTFGATTAQVSAAFNAGRFWGIYSGHGANTYWADGPVFYQSDVNALTNVGMYPFVCSFACVTGTYTDEECFMETWQRAANKGGLVVIGSSVNSYWTEDDVMEKRLFDSIFDAEDAVVAEVGPVWNDAKMRYLAEMGSGSTTRRYFEMYNILGDPALTFPGNCSDAGTIQLDRTKYACEDGLTVRVSDCGLNTNDNVVDTVTVTLSSGLDTELLLLTETSGNSATFENMIAISTTNMDGVLQVAPGSTITATYIDADNGAGQTNVTVTATAVVDCTPPVIGAIRAENIQPRSATIAFSSNEPARGVVHYGLSCTALTQTASGGLSATPTVDLTGLTDNTTYYYTVTASDEAGNSVTDPTCRNFTTPEVPDFFTQLFTNDNDLDNISLQFMPNGSVDFYRGCAQAITALPTDPTGGTALTLSDDGYAQVTLTGGMTAKLYGTAYPSIYVGANGYVTFGSSDSAYTEALSTHFGKPRVAALFDDLDPAQGGQVSWKQLEDRAVVTWLNVPEHSTTGSQNTFQIELYFDGRVTISYLNVTATDGLAGLSRGTGQDPDFLMSDLSAMGPCQFFPPTAHDVGTSAGSGQTKTLALNATDDGMPLPPGVLKYVIASLPASGLLKDPGTGAVIASVPYELVGNGKLVTYQSDTYFVGADTFTYQADDGGVAPDGGLSNVATVSVVVSSVAHAVYSWPLDTNPGWTCEGLWQFGHPTGAGTHGGDPTAAHTGSNVYGYNLAGDYTNSLTPKYLTTTAIDCREVAAAELRFWKWLGIQNLDHASVQVSADGTNWTTVWDFSGLSQVPTVWTQSVYDISAVADGQATVYVRWVMGTTDTSITYPGWNLDDVEIWGLAAPAPCAGDTNCDGQVNWRDIDFLITGMNDNSMAWRLAFQPNLPGCNFANLDTSGDGHVNWRDIDPFIALMNTTCP